MSDYGVLLEVSNAIKSTLWDAFDTDVQNIIGTDNGIVFTDPTTTALDTTKRLSIWLYQVTESEFLKNQPVLQGAASAQGQVPPLSLNLYYLITPFAGQPESDLLLLGKTMQVLYDNAILQVSSPAAGAAEDLRVIFRTIPLSELTVVWEALQETYRLSVSYEVRVVSIDSTRVVSRARATNLTTGFGNKPVRAAST